MSKKVKSIMWIISVLSFLGVCLTYPFLPDQIPTHWTINWEVNKWSDKKYIFILGLMPVAMLLLLDILPKIDPRRENYKKHGNAYQVLQFALVILMVILSWASVASAIWQDFNINKLLPVLMGVIFIVMGNYMPKLKSNYFVCIKNPWTLANDVVWRKTHKAGGYAFTVSGVLMVLTFFFQHTIIYYIAFGVLMLAILGTYLYSYVIYRKISKLEK